MMTMLHMLNNNTFTDFRTACKHVLIHSDVIQVIWQNQNVSKLSANWLFG